MALFKRKDSKNYWLEFTFAGRRYRVSTEAERLPQARDFARHYRQKIYEEVALGRRRHEPMRFEDAVKRYATTHLKTKARLEKTAVCSAYVLAALIRWIGPDTPLDEITSETVANLKETIFDGGARKPATVNKYLADLRSILRMAHFEWSRLGELPRFKLYALKNERTRWLRPEEESRRREKRLAAAIIHVEKTFDAERAGKGFNAELLLMLVREKVLPQHREGLKYKYKIKDEELAAALYVVELASFERKEKRDEMWTVGHNRIAGMLSKIAREKKGKGERDNNTCVSAHQAGPSKVKGVNRNKVRAIKVILQQAGLIDAIDESYRPGRGKSKNSNTCVSAHHDVASAWEEIGSVRGRCKRIVVGANHPRRQEWEREHELFADWVFGGQHPTSKQHVGNNTSAPKIGGVLLIEV